MANASAPISVDSSSEDDRSSEPASAACRRGFNMIKQCTPAPKPNARISRISSMKSEDSDRSTGGRVDFSKLRRASMGRPGGSCVSNPKPAAKQIKERLWPKPKPNKQRLIKPQLKKHKNLGPPQPRRRTGLKQERLQTQDAEFAETTTPAFACAFEWNRLYVEKLRSVAPPTQAVPALSGYFEFAGGGGAEIACKALSAVGVPIEIKSQADWNAGKREALGLQDGDDSVCRFSDIMDCVSEESKSALLSVTEEVHLTHYELLNVLGIERCRVLDGDPDAAATATSSGSSSSGSTSSESGAQASFASSANSSSTASTSSLSSLRANSDHTDESIVLDPNNHELISDENLLERILALFDEEKHLKYWRPGAFILDARHSCERCAHGSADPCSDHAGICSVLVELARADHDCSKLMTLRRRQGRAAGCQISDTIAVAVAVTTSLLYPIP